MRGGARPGAGRPKLATKKHAVSLSLTVALDKVLDEVARDSASKSELAEQLMRNQLASGGLTARQKRLLAQVLKPKE